MPHRPPVHRPHPHSVPTRPPDDRLSAHRRGYGRTWRRARLAWLAEHPLCVHCQVKGVLRAADVVDHVIPHKGDPVLFWDCDNNWMSLCTRCHNHKTATLDGAFGRKVASADDEGRTPQQEPPND
jgi:5-methylcytosine-specific restriction protein A